MKGRRAYALDKGVKKEETTIKQTMGCTPKKERIVLLQKKTRLFFSSLVIDELRIRFSNQKTNWCFSRILKKTLFGSIPNAFFANPSAISLNSSPV